MGRGRQEREAARWLRGLRRALADAGHGAGAFGEHIDRALATRCAAELKALLLHPATLRAMAAALPRGVLLREWARTEDAPGGHSDVRKALARAVATPGGGRHSEIVDRLFKGGGEDTPHD
jgi:hypothetical protein